MWINYNNLPEFTGDVIPSLHDTHENVEDAEDGRTDDELIQKHLLDDDSRPCHPKKPSVQPFVPMKQYDRKHQGSNYPISGTNYFYPTPAIKRSQ